MITDPKVEEYCVRFSTPPSASHQEMIRETQEKHAAAAGMQVGALEGRFLSLITRLMRARNVLEFGTFTGYSALAFAEALPADGRVTTLDLDPKATSLARELWDRSGLGGKIELILAPALESTQKLAAEIAAGSRARFDLVFIDADKANYRNYYEASLALLNEGGAVLVDNVLWGGEVLAPEDNAGRAIAEFNELIRNDSRVEKVLLPIRDGIYLIRPHSKR
jgi:caffeoyl-CoA O-methyltransferase